MDAQEQLKLSSEQWQQNNQRWQEEINTWQNENKLFIALLYMLEKALPEYASKLSIHKARIDKYNEHLNGYRAELEKSSLSAPSSPIELEKHKALHEFMARTHLEMQCEHEVFSRDYRAKVKHFHELAERLINELEELLE